MNKLNKIKKELSTTQVIALGFIAAILSGAILLFLPLSSADGQFTSFIDCLFTSATSVCVTGLTVVSTASHWSLFGKIVILILIQLGGLGIISITTGVMIIIGKRITLRDRLLLEDALNLDTLSGLLKFLLRIFKGTLIIEGFGAIFYSFRFIPEYGFLRGIWYSIFHSVSAFCNAGIDLLGDTSLMKYNTDIYMNIITMSLIVLGGLGFIVWWDISSCIKKVFNKDISLRHGLIKLRLHTKIVVISTGLLIFGGALAIFLLEYTNTKTIGNMTFIEKINASLFQSVTLRTAGFMTVPQSSLRSSTSLICLFLMFIGGSSISTAGGIKTTTLAVLLLSTRATIKGRSHLVVFRKTIPHKTITKALAVTIVSVLVLISATFLLQVVEGGALLDTAYETTSAIATVGLSRDFTSTLHFGGKLIIILCMYLGRIGPISMAIFFSNQKDTHICSYPHVDITVG